MRDSMGLTDFLYGQVQKPQVEIAKSAHAFLYSPIQVLHYGNKAQQRPERPASSQPRAFPWAKRAFRGLPLGHPCPMRGAVTPTATEGKSLLPFQGVFTGH